MIRGASRGSGADRGGAGLGLFARCEFAPHRQIGQPLSAWRGRTPSAHCNSARADAMAPSRLKNCRYLPGWTTKLWRALAVPPEAFSPTTMRQGCHSGTR